MTVSTWTQTDSASWRTWTNDWRSDNSDVYQGQWAGYGLHRGLWFFNDANIRSVLAGEVITKVRIFITRQNSSHGYTSAGVPTIRLHNYSSQPAGAPTMGTGDSSHGVGFTRGESNWVTLPNSFGEALRDNTAKGLGVYSSSDSPYLIFNPAITLEITHVPDTVVPPTPGGFTLDSATNSSISMSWNAAGSGNSAADNYTIDREGGGTVTTAALSYTWGGLSSGLTDRFRVRANNSAGSSAYTGWVTGKTAPATPGGLNQTGSTTSSITMGWNSSSGATAYQIDRSGFGQTYNSSATTHTNTGLAAGTAYSYRVRASNTYNNTGGTSSYSSYVTMYTLCATPAPTTSNVKHYEATVSWSAVTGATSYEIQRRTGAGSYTTVKTQTGTSWTDTGLSPNTQYTYRVRAKNGGGDWGAYGTTADFTTVALPATPTGLATSNVQTNSITLSWNAAAGAQDYRLQRLSTTDVVEQTWVLTGTSQVDAGVQPGGTYKYRVRSESQYGGTSSYSAEVTESTQTMPQEAPTLVTRSNYDAAQSALFDWTFNTSNINDAQAEWDLEIKVVAGAVAYTASGSGTTTEHTVTGGTLTNDTNYEWRVRTKSQLETVFGPWSSYQQFDTVTPPGAVITSPTDSETVVANSILVQWNYSQAASRVQSDYRLQVLEAGTANLVYDTGYVASAAAQHDLDNLAGGIYDITLDVRSGGVDGSGSDTVTNVSLSTNTTEVSSGGPNVTWSPTAGPESTAAFVFSNIDASGSPSLYHVHPKDGSWEKFATATDRWDIRRVGAFERGDTILLTLVAKSVNATGADTPVNSEFRVTLEHDDATEATSYLLDLDDPATISTDVGEGFKRYTTSVVAKKPVTAVRLTSRIHKTAGVDEVTLAELDVSEAGKIASQEYIDTEGQRGLLISGSGFIQGTEIDLKGPGAILNIDGTITADGNNLVGFYNSASNPEITALTGGSTFGNALWAQPSGHAVVSIDPNDNSDGFYVLAPGNILGPESLLSVNAQGLVNVNGEVQWPSDISTKLNFYPVSNYKMGVASNTLWMQATRNVHMYEGTQAPGVDVPKFNLDMTDESLSVVADLNLNDHVLKFADAGTTNIDHIWHDDLNNIYHFVSDGTYKGAGNAKIQVTEIIAPYNSNYILRDHSNGSITLSAAGNNLHLGYQNTAAINIDADIVTNIVINKNDPQLQLIDDTGRFRILAQADNTYFQEDRDNDGTYTTRLWFTSGGNLQFRTGTGGGAGYWNESAGEWNWENNNHVGFGNIYTEYSIYAGTNGDANGIYNASPNDGVRLYGGGTDKIEVKRSGGEPMALRRDTSTGVITTFRYGNTTVGNISVTASATSYNTSSDYRLKENVRDLEEALTRIEKLRPVSFNWKEDGSEGFGFIAHEAQEVLPYIVHGEKDATYVPDGSDQEIPDYQSVDYSKVVPFLVSAVQHLSARVKELEEK